jgi:rhamnosyltransferase
MTDAEASVYAVIVTYKPDLETLERLLGATRSQVDGIVLVDNASGGNEETDNVISRSISVDIPVLLDSNIGLAAAQNLGVERAREAGASHVLFLDQDSIPSPDMVRIMLNTMTEISDSGRLIGAVGARYQGVHAGNESFFVRFGWFKFKRVFCSRSDQKYVRADFLISSGTLVSITALDTVGPMDEQLFIDHIDTDWFLRANAKGLLSYGVCDAVMVHGLGEATYRVWFGRWRFVPKHKPFRYYYIYRNSLLLYRRPYAPVKWIINDIVRLVFIACFFPLFSDSRLDRFKMIARGVYHGVRGVRGATILPADAGTS